MKTNSLLAFFASTLLRLGFLSMLALGGVLVAMEIERRGRSTPPWYASVPHAYPVASDDYEVERLLQDLRVTYTGPAQLHGYPAPAELLDLREYLALSPEQIAEVEDIAARLAIAEKEILQEIIRLEKEIDQALAARELSVEVLHRQAVEVGSLHGRLRATQLEGHLSVATLLSPEQLQLYMRLRGTSQISLE